MARIGYADPPYVGCAHLYKGHEDFAGEVDHEELLTRLDRDYDGWVLHASSTSLPYVCVLAERLGIRGYRIMPWVKPFAAFRRNVSVAYAWEPCLVSPVRKPIVTKEIVMRDWRVAEDEHHLPDWCAESITMKKGLTGAKPPKVCEWLFHVLGAEPDDELVDLYPGTGIVGRTWGEWAARAVPPAAPQKALVS